MDRSGKKIASGVDFGRSRSSIAFRDPNHDTRSIRGCSRLGCSSRHYSTDGSTSSAEKSKSSRTNFRTSITSTFGSSSKAASPVRLRKSKGKKILPSANKGVAAASSHQEDRMEEPDSIGGHEALENLETFAISMSNRNIDDKEDVESRRFSRFPADSAGAFGSRDVHAESRNLSVRQIRPTIQGVSPGSSIHHPIASQNANHSFRAQQGLHIDSQRYRLRNLSCRSITDVLESGCSSSTSLSNRRSDALRRKHPNAESSRCKIASGSSSSRETSTPPTTSNISTPSVTRRPETNSALSRAGNRPTSRYVTPTSRTPDASCRRENRMRFVELGDDMFALPESLLIGQEPQLQSLVHDSPTARSLLPSLTEATQTRPSYNGGYGRGTCGTRSRQGIHMVDGSAEIEYDPFIDRRGDHHFDIDGIAEVLLALDRIEQDEELSYEQLVMLETNLILGGFNFHDQHRDLRLDIDNMSYEELLALGERMGTVNTALSNEEIAKCLRTFTFKSTSISLGGAGGDDDAKCSICQEEYLEGDEVGRLACEHLYHVGCICQWFQLKNWCPICKSPALSSSNETNSQAGQPSLGRHEHKSPERD